ncbi:hypothetical protein F4692_001011 [Nocardioides cavernae]|uniref:DUF3352 domain-containing protein n=1 Tax=Nocardioides cavernae TaxID=1921566 RepID=A0A7Y9KS03_9ACTN|nr:hypothetical protein [Nocardioides cavernae]NYE35907.1 hypothetical protein [Nocardioides cavernae]
MPRRLLAVLVAAVVVAVGAVVVLRLLGPGTPLAQALARAPEATSRASWTDWAAVRRELGADVGPGSSAGEVEAFVDDAFARDLSSMSALGTSAGVIHDELGFSPATIAWELLAQSTDGAVEVIGLGDQADTDDVADRLRAGGWSEPEDDEGVWVGGPDVLAGVGPGLTPELQHVALVGDDLVLASDQVPYLERAVESARGDADGAHVLAHLAETLEEPLAAAVYDGAYACEHLAMGQADADAQSEADQLVEAAGGVHPLSGFAMGVRRGGDVRAVLEVEDADDAAQDAEARARLAAGPAPGQGGDFSDRFAVEAAASDGREVVLDLVPVEGSYVLSDLTSGPVLFATC